MRSGTVPTPLVVGLGAACELAAKEMEVIIWLTDALMDWSTFLFCLIHPSPCPIFDLFCYVCVCVCVCVCACVCVLSLIHI